MTVVAVTHNVTRVEDMEGTPPGTFGNVDLGGGPGASGGAGLHYEALQAAQRRIAGTNSERGFTYVHDSVRNMLNAGLTVVFGKAFTALSSSINLEGTRLGYGDLVTAYYNYQVGDDGTMGDNGEFALPPKGGYVIIPIEVRKSAFHNLVRVGSPNITIIDMFRMSHNVSATTGAGLSQALDSIDMTDDGFFLVSGTPSDPAGAFLFFIAADEDQGDSTAGRVGMWQTLESGTFRVFGNHVIGRTDAAVDTETVFTDSFKTLIFSGGFVGDSFNGLEIELGATNTDIDFDTINITGLGRRLLKRYFDTELDVVGGATDEITITAHGFSTGDQVIYSAEGGSEDIGPNATTGEAENATSSGVAVDSDRWYVVRVDADTIQLSATAAGALAGPATGIEDLTPSTSTNGENHSLTTAPDNRPNLTVLDTVGAFDVVNGVWDGMRVMTLTSAVAITDLLCLNSRSLILADATLLTCTFTGMTTSIGEAFLSALDAIDLDEIDGCAFTSGGLGHAIVVTTGGTLAERTAALLNVDFTSYFANDEDNTGGWSFNASTDVDDSNDEIDITSHGFSTGDPVYYSDEGGTQIVGLVDQNLYYVRAVTANSLSMHLSARAANDNANKIAITTGSNETHKIYSANAAFFNNSGVDLILNITGGGSPTVRNSAGSTTTVNNTVTLTVTVTDSEANPVEGARVRIELVSDGSLVADGETDASGVFTDSSFDFVSPTAVLTKVRLKGFKPFRANGTILSTGLSVGVSFITDSIVDLP